MVKRGGLKNMRFVYTVECSASLKTVMLSFDKLRPISTLHFHVALIDPVQLTM